MKLYGIPNCNTVKKARTWLADHQINVDFHDFKIDGADPVLLNDWVSQMPWEKLLNRSGMTWRNLDEKTKSAVQDNASAVSLMAQKPSVIKRPILVRDGKIISLGFDEAIYQTLLK